MTTIATFADTPTGSMVHLADGDYLTGFEVTRADGDGPIPAVTAVLERNGWQVAGEWVQQHGGIVGDVWTAEVRLVHESFPSAFKVCEHAEPSAVRARLNRERPTR